MNETSLDGSIADKEFKASFAACLAISKDGKWLFVVDEGNWRVVVLNAEALQKVSSISTGRYPFGLALSPMGPGCMSQILACLNIKPSPASAKASIRLEVFDSRRLDIHHRQREKAA